MSSEDADLHCTKQFYDTLTVTITLVSETLQLW